MTPTLVLTRPMIAGERFARAVHARWDGPLTVVQSPAIRIVPLTPEDVPQDTPHLIATSVNGVAQFRRLGLTAETVWCVGDSTAHAASDAGYVARSAAGNADTLVDLILSARPKGRLLHVAGRHVVGDIAGRLTQAGFPCDRIAAYDQELQPPTPELIAATRGTQATVAPVFSARSGLILRGLDWAGPFSAIAISPQVAEALAHVGRDRITTAARPDEAAMIDATLAVLARLQG